MSYERGTIDYKLVVNALADVNLEPRGEDYERGDSGFVLVRNDYSGRSMFGDRCFGIDFDDGRDAYAFIAAITSHLREYEEAFDNDGFPPEMEVPTPVDPIELALQTRTDNMGMGMIAYWPGYRLVNVPDEEEED